jgi:hypothetical protein
VAVCIPPPLLPPIATAPRRCTTRPPPPRRRPRPQPTTTNRAWRLRLRSRRCRWQVPFGLSLMKKTISASGPRRVTLIKARTNGAKSICACARGRRFAMLIIGELEAPAISLANRRNGIARRPDGRATEIVVVRRAIGNALPARLSSSRLPAMAMSVGPTAPARTRPRPLLRNDRNENAARPHDLLTRRRQSPPDRRAGATWRFYQLTPWRGTMRDPLPGRSLNRADSTPTSVAILDRSLMLALVHSDGCPSGCHAQAQGGCDNGQGSRSRGGAHATQLLDLRGGRPALRVTMPPARARSTSRATRRALARPAAPRRRPPAGQLRPHRVANRALATSPACIRWQTALSPSRFSTRTVVERPSTRGGGGARVTPRRRSIIAS